MNIDSSGYGALIIIVVMAVVTLATRWGGVFIMGFVPINDRVQQFISAMSGSVLIAVLTPLAINGDNGARFALLATAIIMLVFKKPLLAIGAGIIVAALIRQFPLIF